MKVYKKWDDVDGYRSINVDVYLKHPVDPDTGQLVDLDDLLYRIADLCKNYKHIGAVRVYDNDMEDEE